MLKDKRMRNILLYLLVVLACVFFIGFSTAKNVCAATNEIKSLFQIYEEFGVTGDLVRNPYDYGDNVLLINSINNYGDFLQAYVFSRPIQYSDLRYDETSYSIYVKIPILYNVSYIKREGSVELIREEIYDVPYDTTTVVYGCCASIENGIERIRNQSPVERIGTINITRNIIYSSFDLKDSNGTVFFSATTRMTLPPIMEKLNTRNQLQPLSQVVSLMPIGLGLVVSLVAFRKVLKVLRTISYQA